MKKLLKILGILVLLIILIALGGIIYLKSTFPRVDKAKDIHVDATPERIKHGEYLANYAMGCMGCHSERDWTKFGGPVKPGTEGMGGEYFDGPMHGIPGILYARNITPSGIGDWTDGELLRAITTGVNKKGEALFPLMPYEYYRNLSEEDLFSIIAYIRTLKPIENKIKERSLDFPMNLIVNTIPENAPEKFASIPPMSDSVAYGAYIVNRGVCKHCHSQAEKGQSIPGLEFAGGYTFTFPDGQMVNSANLTPDNETGIGLLSKEAFIDKFRFYRSENARNMPVSLGDNKTMMPWTMYQGMNDEDLGAIYVYLRTLKPVVNKVEKYRKS